MKLLSCKVDGFGCLRDHSFDFSSNPVCILSDNGTGKTTLTVFIKSMFYGLCGDGKRSETESERKKYKPWDSDVFGGNIEFESSKGKFRIERYFGKKEADDTFKLIDLSTKRESSAYSKNVGVELFGIDVESYSKSTYMPQGNKDFSATTSITTKLGELIEASDDAKSFDSAVSLLDKYIKTFRNLRGGGIIPDLEKEKFETEKKILELEKKIVTLSEKRETLENYEKELAELPKSQKNSTKNAKKSQTIKSY